MVESTSGPSGPINRIIERFERDSSWTLSPQAKTIIICAFESIYIDRYGLGRRVDPGRRDILYLRAEKSLPDFLNLLSRRAERQLFSFSSTSAIEPTSIEKEKEIGGVLLLQNMQVWQQYMRCGCWPRDGQ